MLETNGYVEQLILRRNAIENGGAIAIAKMLEDSTYISYADLSANKIGSTGLKKIGDMLKVIPPLSVNLLKSLSWPHCVVVDQASLVSIYPKAF